MKILFLTNDGLSDPLGQSQVLPYMKGLSAEGHEITIVSFEKKRPLKIHFDSIKKELDQCEIKWVIIKYTKYPPVLSTVYDIYKLHQTCKRLQKENQFHVVHCRAYIPSLAGLSLKKNYGVKYVFDMRGFYADERVEGGLWDQDKWLYRKVYQYFKKKEKEFLAAADKVVALTNAGKNILTKSFDVDNSKIIVIPCCADTNQFDPDKVDRSLLPELKKKLFIDEKDLVVSYLGAIGTWYLLDEMLDFFLQLLQTYPNAKFLFITHHSPDEIRTSAARKNISKDKIVVVKANRNEVPLMLSLSHLSIYFIIPTYSKLASSPTKQAELFSMGIPVICNAPVGDAEEIIRMSDAGLIINQFTSKEYENAINKIPLLMNKDKNKIRAFAIRSLSLEIGIARYQSIYAELAGEN